MPDVRFADGFDAAEPLLFGLGAAEVGVAAAGLIGAATLIRSGLPGYVSIPLAVVLGTASLLLALVKRDGRSGVEWALRAVRYAAAPRSGVLLAATSGATGRNDLQPSPPPEPIPAAPPPPPPPPAEKPPYPQPGSREPWWAWFDDDNGPTPAAPPPALPQTPSASPLPAAAIETPVANPQPPVATQREALVLVPEPASAVPAEGPSQPSSDSPRMSATFRRLAEASTGTTPAPRDAPPAIDPEEVDDEEPDDSDERGMILPIFRGDGELEIADAAQAQAPAATRPPSNAPAVFVGATRRLTFFSLNGGSGRSTLATEIAGILAAQGRHQGPADERSQPLRVALLDLDVRSATVAVRLGIPQPSIWDWVISADADANRLDDYMVTHSSGVRALLGPQKPMSTVGSALTPAHVADIVHELERQGTQFIIFDIAADLGDISQWVLNAVHDIFVVITPTASGIQDAYRSTEALRRMGLRHKLGYVVNRSRGRFELGETMADLGGRIAVEIPYDVHVEDAENEHRLATLDEQSAAGEGFRTLAARIYPGLQRRAPRRRRAWWRRRAG
ncbi:MAG: hypothetical protein ACR2GX_09555 [Candidatus Dormibacteria bacterium]